MTEKKNGLLQIPQGVEGLYLEEAFRHRKITKHIENVFTLWGYLPVETPVFDFFDTYSHLLDKNRAEQTYRLIDREGELLMLRSDITLFLAKQMSLALDEKDLPVRVFYADTILR
jgi:ATP phosphoribosyltransferase regulatory subunit